MVGLTVWLEMPLPAAGGGSQPAVRQAGLFVLVSDAYLAAPPTQERYACLRDELRLAWGGVHGTEPQS